MFRSALKTPLALSALLSAFVLTPPSWTAPRPPNIGAGRVVNDLVDFSDFLPTFAELAGAPLPQGIAIDGRSFVPQLRGEKGHPREWVYVQHNTAAEWYVREQGWKLTQGGELFDMSDTPFVEKLVSEETADDAANAARQRLQAVLAQLNPIASPLVGKPADTPPPKKKKKKKKPVNPHQPQAVLGAGLSGTEYGLSCRD